MSDATSVPDVRRHLGHGRFILMSLYWVAIGYMWQSLGALILPHLVRQLVGSAHKGVALSVLEGIGTVMAVVWQPVIGSISDRSRSPWGRRRPFILAGTVGDVLFLAGIALSGNYWAVVVFYLLLQTASNTAQAPYQGLLPDVVPDSQRGTASGYYGLANLIGILTGTVGAGLLLGHFGRGAAIGSIAALLVVTMLITITIVPDTVKATAEPFESPLKALAHTFRFDPREHADFMWLMASRLLILMGIIGLQTYSFFYFGDVFFPNSPRRATFAATTLLGLVIGMALLVTLPAARMSDRVGRRPMIVAGGLLGAAGTLFLVFSHYELLPEGMIVTVGDFLRVPPLAAQAMFAGLVIGIGFGAFLSVDWAYITDVIPLAESGRFMGISNIATAGAGIIARFLAGFVLDAFNDGPPILGLPGGYPAVFTMFCVWIVIGSLLVLKVKRR